MEQATIFDWVRALDPQQVTVDLWRVLWVAIKGMEAERPRAAYDAAQEWGRLLAEWSMSK